MTVSESRTPRWKRRLAAFGAGAQNAAELLRGGRLGAPYRASFEVAAQTEHFSLRHYGSGEPTEGAPLLLVPPLMVTSEIYDIAPELSAVTWLGKRSVDVWLVDFGRPEESEGGLSRTLDDHVLAVDACIDHVREATGNDVHVAGYSQGGMFVYQVAAYRRTAGIASLITFGSPVDIHRNVPAMHDAVAGRLLKGVRSAVKKPLQKIDGLPGALTSTGFKVLSVRKEVQQFFGLFTVLHDREALEKREQRRRFLAGEGFVAWPGPAFRDFVDQFVVHNRMKGGGFVIGDRTVTLADITCPILYAVGTRDEIARPASVRAIRDEVPRADLHELPVRAGHFGLVVGSTSLRVSWPTVVEWLQWVDGRGPLPERLAAQEADEIEDVEEAAFEEIDLRAEEIYDVATSAIESLWGRVGATSRELGAWMDVVRWQLPRLAKLQRLDDGVQVSLGRALAEQAAAIPDETFFLWQGRAFSYSQANERVEAVVRGLWHCGVRPGDRVAVQMSNRPSYLSLVAALSRLGAVACLVDASFEGDLLARTLRACAPAFVVADPERAPEAAERCAVQVLVLGGAGVGARSLPAGLVDMEAIDPTRVALPNDVELDAGFGGDLSMILFTAGTAGQPRAARITNQRWALAALGSAAGGQLTTSDTVYCCLPLHRSTAMLVTVGGALVGGARLALAPRFDAERFWPEVRRTGASVVFYVGDMLRGLLEQPEEPGESQHPVRIWAGRGMPIDVWEDLNARFGGARVSEFYASTEGNVALVNLNGVPIGSVGRPLPGSPEIALVEVDDEGAFVRDGEGHLVPVADGDAGMLLARVESDHALGDFDGFLAAEDNEAATIDSPFGDGELWFVSGDLLRRDAAGEWWFVARNVAH